MNEHERVTINSAINLIEQGYQSDGLRELSELVAASERCVYVPAADGRGPGSLVATLERTFGSHEFDASRTPQGSLRVTWKYGPTESEVASALQGVTP